MADRRNRNSQPPINEPAAPAVHTSKSKGHGTVTVALKTPMSIILQLCQARNVRVTGQFGSTEEVVHVPVGAQYVIRGTSYPALQPPKGFPKRPNMIEDEREGYALTYGIPAEFWASWLEQNEQTDMVQNGIIRAHHEEASLEDMVSDFAKTDSGLGPINPEGDRRNPKPASTAVSEIKEAELAS